MPDSRDSHIRVSYKDNPGFFQCNKLHPFGILLVIASFSSVLYWNEVKRYLSCKDQLSFFRGVNLKEYQRDGGGGGVGSYVKGTGMFLILLLRGVSTFVQFQI